MVPNRPKPRPNASIHFKTIMGTLKRPPKCPRWVHHDAKNGPKWPVFRQIVPIGDLAPGSKRPKTGQNPLQTTQNGQKPSWAHPNVPPCVPDGPTMSPKRCLRGRTATCCASKTSSAEAVTAPACSGRLQAPERASAPATAAAPEPTEAAAAACGDGDRPPGRTVAAVGAYGDGVRPPGREATAGAEKCLKRSKTPSNRLPTFKKQ